MRNCSHSPLSQHTAMWQKVYGKARKLNDDEYGCAQMIEVRTKCYVTALIYDGLT